MSAYDATTEPRFDPDPALGTEADFHADERLQRDLRNGNGRRSIVGLLRELTAEGRELLSLEVELAKTEMSEKVSVYERNAVGMAAGAGVLLAALLMGAWTVNAALTALLDTFMALEIAVWLAPLILTVALGAIGWSLVSKGLTAMRNEGMKPTRTIDSLKADKRWAERKVHS